MDKHFEQLVVWTGTLVSEDEIDELVKSFAEVDFRIKYEGQFKTLAGQGGEGGRNDILFYIHNDEIPRFALWRLGYDMKWWEDFYAKYKEIIPDHILAKYPKTW